MGLQVQSPFQQFFDLDGGPLDNGSIYIGNSGQNPQQYPIPIFWDQAGTIPALQPVKTLNGYAVRNGTPARIYVENVDYSITAKDSRGRVVFTALSVTAVTFNSLAAPTGSSLIGFQQTGANTVARTVLDRGRDAVSIKDYANYATNAAQAILDMAADYGFVRIPFGNYPVGTSITISVPIWFDEGAAITAAGGITITINNVIESPRQFIFQGTGNYAIGHNLSTGVGEDARHVHVKWFGAKTGDPTFDNGVVFQKLTDSMDNTREAHIQLDVGTYYVQTPTVWRRASYVKGMGDRLTNIWAKFLDGNVFSTSGTGCRFYDLQFNADDFRTSGAYIALLSDRCKVFDTQLDHGFIGIDMRNFECEAHRTKGLTWSSAPGSRLIRVAADDCLVDTYNYTVNTDNGPEYVVANEVVAGNANRARIFKGIVKTNAAGHGVGILHNAIGSVQSAHVENLTMIAGNVGVYVRNTGTTSPNVIDIKGIKGIVGSGVVDLVAVENTSTGAIFSVNIDDVIAQVVSGSGIRISRLGTGAIRNVSIGSHDISAATGILVAGTSTVNIPENVSIAPGNCHNCTGNGYDITALVVVAPGLISRVNTGIGVRIGLGTNHALLAGVSFGNGTDVSDLSGAVTKSINIIN